MSYIHDDIFFNGTTDKQIRLYGKKKRILILFCLYKNKLLKSMLITLSCFILLIWKYSSLVPIVLKLSKLNFYSRLLPTYGWQKDGGSMRFTELGLIVRRVFSITITIDRYHLLHISFFLIKEGFKYIIIVIYSINKKRKNNIISSIRSLIGC